MPIERKKYQSMIWEYEKRRDVMREKYGIRTPEYKEAVRNIRRKLNGWRCQIRRIDKRNEQINALIKAVNQYFNVKIEGSKGCQKTVTARYVFYKYGLEKKLYRTMGTHLSEAINRNKREAYRRRLSFTKSFKTNPQNKQAYHNFKNYIESK
jgi:hypothetical protein